jgi:hypothetical protein
MSEAYAITNEGWTRWVRRAIAAVAGCLLVLVTVFNLVWIGATRRAILRADAQALRLTEIEQDHKLHIEEATKRLDDLERMIGGDIFSKMPKTVPPGPNRIELWQQNRDKVFRDQITVLQRRLLRIDDRVQTLERAVPNPKEP